MRSPLTTNLPKTTIPLVMELAKPMQLSQPTLVLLSLNPSTKPLLRTPTPSCIILPPPMPRPPSLLPSLSLILTSTKCPPLTTPSAQQLLLILFLPHLSVLTVSVKQSLSSMNWRDPSPTGYLLPILPPPATPSLLPLLSSLFQRLPTRATTTITPAPLFLVHTT